MMEQVLEDMAAATDLRAIILRYFNPIGSDPDLESGIYAKEPSHVLGQLVMAARGLKDHFTITGTEHPTPDGTGIRDYIHVWDLARAHVRAVERFDEVLAEVGAPSTVINVGTGAGVTRARAGRVVRAGLRPRGAGARRRRRGPATPSVPTPTSTSPPAPRLAGRALPRRRHRLRPRLGREAPGDPGLRVSCRSGASVGARHRSGVPAALGRAVELEG